MLYFFKFSLKPELDSRGRILHQERCALEEKRGQTRSLNQVAIGRKSQDQNGNQQAEQKISFGQAKNHPSQVIQPAELGGFDNPAQQHAQQSDYDVGSQKKQNKDCDIDYPGAICASPDLGCLMEEPPGKNYPQHQSEKRENFVDNSLEEAPNAAENEGDDNNDIENIFPEKQILYYPHDRWFTPSGQD